MGGNSKGDTAPTASNDIAASLPAYLKNARAATQPAFMPGQQAQLAQQLTAGFPAGANNADYLRMLAQTYQPAQTMNFGAPAVSRPVAAKIAAKPAVRATLPASKAPARPVSLGHNAR